MNILKRLKARFFAKPPVSLETARSLQRDGAYAEAVAQLRELAQTGSAEAAYELAGSMEVGAGTLQNPASALIFYTQAAESGHLPSIVRLGQLYLSGLQPPDTVSAAAVAQLKDPKGGSSLFQQLFPAGLSVEPDAALAARWNLAGAIAGDSGCQARLGHQYAAGLGLPQSLLLARKWFRRAAAGGDVLGALGMGLLSLDHYGVAARHYDPVPWLDKAIEGGDVTAALALALYLIDLPDSGASERAGKLLLKAAKAGHPFAMLKLGDCYAAGAHGVPKSAENAEFWLRRAAAKGLTGANIRLLRLLASSPDNNEQELALLARDAAEAGDGEAQYVLGVFALSGKGTLEDPIEAAKWFELAAAQGVAGAHERLGALYATGVGKPADPAQAVALFEQAVAQGDLDALTHRAMLRQSGVGIEQDVHLAAEEFRRAADAGHPEAALQLGIAYASGLGVSQDWGLAAHYYRLAYDGGAPEGAFNLGHLTEQGLGVEADAAAALALFEWAANRGLVAAMWACYQRSPAESDGQPSHAQRHWLTQAARFGDTEAQQLLSKEESVVADATDTGLSPPAVTAD